MAAAPLLFTFLVLNLNLNPFGSQAQSLVQPRFDGFVYGGKTSDFNPDAILIEAFFDPVCPDTRDTWPPLKQALEFYGSRRVSLIVHTFPLPYHDNSFITSRALHVVDGLNSSATYPLLELFFSEQLPVQVRAIGMSLEVPETPMSDCQHLKLAISAQSITECGITCFSDSSSSTSHQPAGYRPYQKIFYLLSNVSSDSYMTSGSGGEQPSIQEKFYNIYTSNTTKIDTVNRIIDLVAVTVGQKYYSAIKSGFSDQLTDLKTRFAFKYGSSRGVYGTPTFILNGVVLPDAGSPVDYAGWRKLIDPLVGSKKAQ